METSALGKPVGLTQFFGKPADLLDRLGMETCFFYGKKLLFLLGMWLEMGVAMAENCLLLLNRGSFNSRIIRLVTFQALLPDQKISESLATQQHIFEVILLPSHPCSCDISYVLCHFAHQCHHPDVLLSSRCIFLIITPLMCRR